MGEVVRFPIMPRRPIAVPQPLRVKAADPPAPARSPHVDTIIGIVWFVVALCWTVMRFILPVVVFWQFLRMIWFWDTPGVYAGWQFLAYFAGYTALYWFVGVYRPKFMREDATRGGSNVRK